MWTLYNNSLGVVTFWRFLKYKTEGELMVDPMWLGFCFWMANRWFYRHNRLEICCCFGSSILNPLGLFILVYFILFLRILNTFQWLYVIFLCKVCNAIHTLHVFLPCGKFYFEKQFHGCSISRFVSI